MINFKFDYDEVVITSCSDIQFDSCGGQVNGYVGRVKKCTFCGGQ